jgi:Flp pilus assembly protein TadD
VTLFHWTDEDIYLVARRAYEFYAEGRTEEAAAIFMGLLALDPANLYCLDALTAVCLASGQPQEAVRCASTLLRLAPEHPGALARRCEAYIQLGDMESARADLQTLSRLQAASEHRQLQLRLDQAGRQRSALAQAIVEAAQASEGNATSGLSIR